MRAAAVAALVVLGASVLDAHVTVLPRQSPAGAEQRYTVRVPTEGQVTTTSVELEVPADVTITQTSLLASQPSSFSLRETHVQARSPGRRGSGSPTARAPTGWASKATAVRRR